MRCRASRSTVEGHTLICDLASARIRVRVPDASTNATLLGPLADLRYCYLLSERAELDWVILLQAAKAARDANLIGIATSAEEDAQRCGRWLRTRIKAAAAQALALG